MYTIKNKLPLCLVLILLLSSCKKDIGESIADTGTHGTKPLARMNNTSEAVDKIKTWLLDKSKESPKKEAVVEALMPQLKFSALSVENLDNEYDYITIPIGDDYSPANTSNAINHLVVLFDDREEIASMRIAQYTGNALSLPANTYADLFRNQPVPDGKYTFFNLAERNVFDYTFASGRMTQNNYLSWGEIDFNSCEPVWWVHVDIYPDRYEVEVELLGTFCHPDELDTGGGGGGVADYDCAEEEKKDYYNEVENTTASGQFLASYELNIDPITRHKSYRWRVVEGYTGWDIVSTDLAIQKYNTAMSRWEFQSITHSNLSLVGSPPPFVDISFTLASAVPTVTTLVAGMHISLDVTYSFIAKCPNIPILGQILPKVTKSYSRGAFFNTSQ